MNLPEQLKHWRKVQSLSQPQAALKLGVPVGTLRNWEQNIRTPSMASLVYLDMITRPTIDLSKRSYKEIRRPQGLALKAVLQAIK